MLWTPIREVLGSNLGRDTGYSEGFLWIYSVPLGKCQDSTWVRPRPLPSISSEFIYHPTIRRYSLDTDSVVQYHLPEAFRLNLVFGGVD
jgi:hypothetical protein